MLEPSRVAWARPGQRREVAHEPGEEVGERGSFRHRPVLHGLGDDALAEGAHPGEGVPSLRREHQQRAPPVVLIRRPLYQARFHGLRGQAARSRLVDVEHNGRFGDGQRLIVVAEGCAQWLSPPLSGSEGDRLDLGTIQLVPEAILEGRAPPHARVCLDHTGLAGIAFTTEADGAGRYAFRGLPAGTYELSYHSAAGRKATIQPSKTSVTLAVGERRDLSSAH